MPVLKGKGVVISMRIKATFLFSHIFVILYYFKIILTIHIVNHSNISDIINVYTRLYKYFHLGIISLLKRGIERVKYLDKGIVGNVLKFK